MNKKIIIFFCFCLILIFKNNLILADTITKSKADMSNWTFIMITDRSDQDDEVVISKFYDKNNKNNYAFCIEPGQSFTPIKSTYYKEKYIENNEIFNIVKAFDSIENKDNEYYIATQLLIWKETCGIDYTFNGNDYNDYKKEILNIVKNNKPLLKNNIQETYESYIEEESLIEGNYTDYEITPSENIEILANNKNGISYMLKNTEELQSIDLVPIVDDIDNSYVLESDTSQDLYYHYGEYKDLKPLSFLIKPLSRSNTVNINYSKFDIENNPIMDCSFTLYEINEEGSNDLIFINKNKDINLFEILLDDPKIYNNLSIMTSERYSKYLLENGIINTNEVGFFPYKIFNNEILIKEGVIYASDDENDTNSLFNIIKTNVYYNGKTSNTIINTIHDVEKNKKYYLCESSPANGYEYIDNPCKLVDTSKYNEEIISFVNKSRRYTLRLVKESPQEIPLNGAVFKVTYNDNDNIINNIYVTGSLIIDRKDSNKYLFYKKINENSVNKYEFNNSDTFELNNTEPGKYQYYQSNNDLYEESRISENVVDVIKGGFEINDLPYSSSLRVEELKAPNGFVITEPVYYLEPNIEYSDITFKNYRVNFEDIIPGKFVIPKTCVN